MEFYMIFSILLIYSIVFIILMLIMLLYDLFLQLFLYIGPIIKLFYYKRLVDLNFFNHKLNQYDELTVELMRYIVKQCKVDLYLQMTHTNIEHIFKTYTFQHHLKFVEHSLKLCNVMKMYKLSLVIYKNTIIKYILKNYSINLFLQLLHHDIKNLIYKNYINSYF